MSLNYLNTLSLPHTPPKIVVAVLKRKERKGNQ
jgi:hypothetical protein